MQLNPLIAQTSDCTLLYEVIEDSQALGLRIAEFTGAPTFQYRQYFPLKGSLETVRDAQKTLFDYKVSCSCAADLLEDMNLL
ncbi:MAG: hypothetical protein LIO46_07290 [Clostridiales bacterium]|nr:hypothetical protein [Clostridiales bacterium]